MKIYLCGILTKLAYRDYAETAMTELTLKAIETLLDEKFEQQARLINRAFQQQKDHFDKEIARLEGKIDALSAKLTAHLELSDKRYLELKRREMILAKWIKQIADKTGVPIDLAELEKF